MSVFAVILIPVWPNLSYRQGVGCQPPGTPAPTQPSYQKVDLGGINKKEVSGDQTNVQNKNKGPCCLPVASLKNRKGGLNDQSAGVPAQGTPTSCAECLFAQWSPPPHLPSRVCWDGAWRQAPPPVKLGEQGATCSEFLGASQHGPPDPSTSLRSRGSLGA